MNLAQRTQGGMPNDKEQHNDNAAGPRNDADLQLGRTVFLRHAAFSTPDSLARDTIRRYASFPGKTAGLTIARWSASGNWLNLEWLKGASPVRRKATSKVAKQAATARSVPVPTAGNESLTATAPQWASADRVEASTTPAPLEPESPITGRLAIAGVPGASILTTAGGAAPSVYRARTGIETDRARTGLPVSADDQKLHHPGEHQGQQERETIPEPTGIGPSASFTSTPAFTGGIPGGQPTIHSTVTERRAAKTFHGPPIFQRSHVRRVRAAEGQAGRPENVVSGPAGRPGLPGRTDNDTNFAKQQAIHAEQDASPMLNNPKAPGDAASPVSSMLNKSTGAVGAASPVEPVLLQPSALASAKVPESFDAQQALHRSYSQPDSAESITSDSAAAASSVGTRVGSNNDPSASPAGPPAKLPAGILNSDAAPAVSSVVVRSNNTSSLTPAALVQSHPVQSAIQRHRDGGGNSNPPLLSTSGGPTRIARAQSAAESRAASSPRVTPEKSTLSAMPKENSSSPGHMADPEAVNLDIVSRGSAQVSSTISVLGESTYRFLQSRRAAALDVPAVQKFSESLLQRHGSVLIANAGTEAGSRTDSPASRAVVQPTATPQQFEAGAAIALSARTGGNQSANENLTVLRAATLDPPLANKLSPLEDLTPARNAASDGEGHDPDHPAYDRDPAKPDSSESPSPHSAGHPAVMAERTLEAAHTVGMVFSEPASLESTIGNPEGASFAGAGNEPSARDHLGLMVARTGQASPLSSTGFEATPMVSRTSMKTSSASLADASSDVPRSQAQSSLRSGQNAVHIDVRALGQALQPSLPPDSATGDFVAASLAGVGNKPAAQDPSVSTVAGIGPASPAGFEAAPMVSRTSLKTGVATSAGTGVDVVQSHLSSSFRSGQLSAVHWDAGTLGQALQPSSRQDAPHSGSLSHSVEHLPSGDVTFHQQGTMPATAYVLRTSSDPAYTSQWRDEQAPPVTGGKNLHRNASAFTPAPLVGAPRNPLNLFPTSATPSRHSSSGPVLMHHASSSARGPQSIAASAQGDLLFRTALSTPPVPAAPGSSLSGFPSAAQPASPTAPNLKNVDVAQLANRVYELLVRRLSSERQRRGM